MDSPEFGRALHLALGEAQLHYAKQVVGARVGVLREAGFWSLEGVAATYSNGTQSMTEPKFT